MAIIEGSKLALPVAASSSLIPLLTATVRRVSRPRPVVCEDMELSRLACSCQLARPYLVPARSSSASPPQSRWRRDFATSSVARATVTNHYTTLGLKQGATKTEIKHKFYELSKNYHPDRNPNNPYAVDRFKQVSAAYGVLSDPETRRQHDSELSSKRGGWAGGGGGGYTSGAGHAAYGGFDYGGPGNTERRRSANYAWNTSGGYNSANARAQANARPDPFGFGFGRAGARPVRPDFERFARMARRQAESEREKWERILRERYAASGEGAAKEGAKNAVFLSVMVLLAMVFGSSFTARAAEPEAGEPGRGIEA